MGYAYALVNMTGATHTEKQSTQGFLEGVRKLGYVREASEVFGIYDAILKIEYGNDMEMGTYKAEIKRMKDVRMVMMIDFSDNWKQKPESKTREKNIDSI